jgi:hypothetical protein
MGASNSPNSSSPVTENMTKPSALLEPAGALIAALGRGTYALDFCFPRSSRWRDMTPLREGWISKERLR